jgi:two-component system sensor histidine kinase BaeS
MKTYFSKILIAQVIAVALALVVVAVITRVSLHRGFSDFLQTQEATVLENVAPVLEEVFETQGSWQSLANDPQSWRRIWRSSREQLEGPPPRGPGQRPGPRRNNRPPPPPPGILGDHQALRWMRSSDRGMLRERLFLLDDGHKRVAGAQVDSTQELKLQPIEFEGQVVGWIGFTSMGNIFPPEAERFFRGQLRITAVALAIGLVAAAALAFLLARNLSRPVRQLEETVKSLSQGEYDSRSTVITLDETGRLAGHINQLAATLEKNRTARRRWMADIAHELRTPVAVLKGEIEALSDGIRPADERMSRSLQEEVEQLSTLIDDLQTLALSDAGALNILKEPVSLHALLQQCAEAYRDRLAQRGIDLQVQVSAQEIAADPQRLRQLIHNLMENACRYVNEGARVSVQHRVLNEGCELVIEDSGPGLNDKDLSRLFERFYRVDESRTRSRGGAGLGLSICKNIVEAHGGRIEAEHSALGGLKIRIELPAG